MAGRGFAQLPNYLLLLNQFLDDEHRLSPVELLVLFQLVGGWWKRTDLPFPSIGTLARRCGVSDRQIQRALARLERLQLVTRTKRRSKRGLIASNAYDLSPLVSVLSEVAKSFPNEFPRGVTSEKRREISARLPMGAPTTDNIPEGKLGAEALKADASQAAPAVISPLPSASQPKRRAPRVQKDE